MNFLLDVLKCRTERNRLRAENGRLKADVRWLSDENASLTAALGEAVRNNARIGRELLKSISHPSVRSGLRRVSQWN